ncbi:MAG: alpha/beta hydrolase [Proteobacteria bacterium]|nr:alpha/beta hydrolase [Pseudomonadota bacterium]
MSIDTRKDGEIPGPAAAERADTISNTALYKRPKPRTVGEYVMEVLKTGNPLAWGAMKAMEPRFEFETRYTPEGADPDPVLKEPERYGLGDYKQRSLHLDTGESVTCWYKAAQPGYPTIAYCHGNAGSLDSRSAILKELTDRGFGLIIAAYPGFKGHKPRPGIDASETACNATGHAMVRYLVNTKRLDMDKIVLFGESLGGAVALRTALTIEKGIPELNYPPMKVPAVICFNTFTSLVRRAREQFPMLPAHALMSNRFESDKIIKDIQAPILLMHGREDEYTPCRHSVQLREASGGKATLQLIDGVTHAATFPGTERKDMEQVRRVIDCAQQYLHEQKLCPPPPAREAQPPETWQKGVRNRAAGSDLPEF